MIGIRSAIGTIHTGFDEQSRTLRRTLLESERCRVVAGLLLLLVVRVVYLLFCPLELIPDEAYYWDWSRQLDWSYYSKPPLIAWLIAFATYLGGDSEFSIRLPATLLGTLGQWGVYELGRRIYGHKTGLWALLAVAASPGITALSVLMTTDAPLLAAWTLSVYCLWRMFESDTTDIRWLVPAIIATGAGLLSKQTALGLFPLAVVFLASGSADRPKLKSVSFWLWLIGSASCLLPVMWWNQSHGWKTVEHTRDHFAPQSISVSRHLTLFLEFVGSQFGILSPVVCGLLLLVTTVLLTMSSRLQRRERFLLCFGGLPMVAVLALSFLQRVQPNWPAALHLTGFILVAAWSCGDVTLSPRWDAFRTWLPSGIALGAVMSVAVAVVPFVIPGSPLSGTKVDPTGRLRGWREVATQVADELALFPHEPQVLMVAVTARGPVSELAYYLPGKPRVYRWNSGEVVDSQHDVWGGPTDGVGRDALILTEGLSPVPPRLTNAFMTMEELGPIVVTIGPTRSLRYRVWRGGNLRAWPERFVATSTLAIRPSPASQ